MITTFLILLGALVIGSIPSGAWIANWYKIDITKVGSGNIGATNAARTLGMTFFFIVLFLDCIKAYAYLAFLSHLKCPLSIMYLAALFLVIGNGYSIFLRGKGGKGVSTIIGIMLYMVPSIVPVLFIIWFIAFCATRTVGIASVTALSCLPLISYFIYPYAPIVLMTSLSVWSIMKHTENIKNYFGYSQVTRSEHGV